MSSKCNCCGQRTGFGHQNPFGKVKSGIKFKSNKEFDLVQHLYRQMDFSEKTFGPGIRTKGVIDHIKKELIEIEKDPEDVEEWVDVVLLALDGAWRAGWRPEQIVEALETKQNKNENRKWPDWRTAPKDQAITHIKE